MSSTDPQNVYQLPTPQDLRPFYSDFLNVSGTGKRILFTGHSHQAWPNVAKLGVIEAFDDAALHVDDKWEKVFQKAEVLRQDIASSLAVQPEEIALAQNTHELFTRFLSALPLKEKPLIIASDGEFHSVYRQLSALIQAGLIDVYWVQSSEADRLSERIVEAVKVHHNRCAAVVTSSVLFQSGAIVQELEAVATSCARYDIRLFIDAYHSFKIVPLSLSTFEHSKHICYVSGGGYKYAQWGEGACWLRVPKEDHIKPIYTGWFSDFAHLHLPRYESTGQARMIHYGDRPAERFAGSTFDPTSLYRAAKVVQFFNENNLTIRNLRKISLRQTQRLLDGLSLHLEPITPVSDEQRAGFIAFRVPNAQQWSKELRHLGVYTDARGNALRFGPAPYVLDDEIDETIRRTMVLIERNSK